MCYLILQNNIGLWEEIKSLMVNDIKTRFILKVFRQIHRIDYNV
jgi:hypothetical protein